MRWEHDTWWWEEAGCFVGDDGVKRWYFGHRSQAVPVPWWAQWVPEFYIRFPDKVAHAVVHFVLTLLLARWVGLWAAVVVPPVFGLWYELRGWASWKDLAANTVGWGLALWVVMGCPLPGR